MLKIRTNIKTPLRRLSSVSKNNALQHLKDRSLIRVSGPEVINFLQGLITNDMQHLSGGQTCMYSLFLNTRGRVLYDSIIYKTSEKDTVWLECDREASNSLQKHLKMYRVRRKIDIADLGNEYSIYSVFNLDQTGKTALPDVTSKIDDLIINRDPRISNLGYRIISKLNTNVAEQIKSVVNLTESKVKSYRWLRYFLGVGEGVNDLPPGDCFPLECNCDYLHGISFHKGCYVGQELTARVHHTGVVRKRLMPIFFTKVPTSVPEESIIQNESGNLGKFRGFENDVGLGLLRIDKALGCLNFKIGDGVGTTARPNWWPTEAPKEKIHMTKTQ